MELRQEDFSVGPRNPDCNGTEPPFFLHARPNAIEPTVSATETAMKILFDDIASYTLASLVLAIDNNDYGYSVATSDPEGCPGPPHAT